MIRKALSLSVLTALLVGFATAPVSAAAMLRLSTVDAGGSPVSVELTDTDGDGQISHNGPLGDFSVTMTTGLTKPTLGTAEYPVLDILSFELSGAVGGTLEIEFIETDFVVDDLVGMLTSIGGTTTGSVTFDTYVDDDNVAFARTNHLASIGPLSASTGFGGTFGAESLDLLPSLQGSYSATLVVTVTHDGQIGMAPQSTSFDAELRPVPEPATVGLMGVGGIALLLAARRRRRAN